MPLSAITIPTQNRQVAKSKISAKIVEQAMTLLESGTPVSDQVVYSEPVAKRQPRDVAYYIGHSYRTAILEHSDKYNNKELKVRTWAVGEDDGEGAGGGYMWALTVKS